MSTNPTRERAAETQSDLTRINENILEAEEAGSTEDLAQLLHKQFAIIRAKGVRQTRQEYLDAVPSNAHRGRTSEPPEIDLYEGCAVVASRVSTSEGPDGTPTVGHFWNTRVFVQEDGRWLCVAWQVTAIPAV
jgi:hypothetical protein